MDIKEVIVCVPPVLVLDAGVKVDSQAQVPMQLWLRMHVDIFKINLQL